MFSIRKARSKCALCNETLTHIVKMAEVASGAGTATVTRELAARMNENAAPLDRVTPDQLRDRVRRQDGSKWAERPNKPAAPPEPKPSRPVRSLHIPSDETRKTDLISPAFEAAFNAFAAECRNDAAD